MKIFWLILKREVLPAGEGKGIFQYIFYRIPMFYLPVIGIGLLLLIVSYTGLCLVGAEQNVENRINKIKTSPFTALFGKRSSSFYIEACEGNNKNFFNLGCWEAISSDEVAGFSDFPEKTHLFSSVKPISWVDIEVETKDGEHLRYQRGLGLPISGEYADMPFIMEIKNNIIKGNKDEIKQGILVSLKGLDVFGWRHYNNENDKYPDFLFIKLHHRSKNKNMYIPLRVFVVKRLPYQFLYMFSMYQLHLLETGYYDRKIFGFEISFLKNTYNQSYISGIKKIFEKQKPEISDIKIDGKPALRIVLETPVPRVEIMNKLYKAKLYNPDIRLSMGNKPDGLTVNYQGAIFHLNFRLPHGITWSKEHVYSIQNFMEDKGVTVKGELVEILSEMMNIQKNFRSLNRLFYGLLICMALILLLFCGVVLHNRIYRIGIKLMIGTSEWVIVAAYCFLSIFLITVSFISAIIIITRIFIPMNLSLSLYNSAVIKLYIELLLITMLSFTIPIKFFLSFYKPSEMISYRA